MSRAEQSHPAFAEPDRRPVALSYREQRPAVLVDQWASAARHDH